MFGRKKSRKSRIVRSQPEETLAATAKTLDRLRGKLNEMAGEPCMAVLFLHVNSDGDIYLLSTGETGVLYQGLLGALSRLGDAEVEE